MPSKRATPEDADRLGVPRREYVVTVPWVEAVYRGSVPDTDPMYRRGWSIVSGSSSSPPSLPPSGGADTVTEPTQSNAPTPTANTGGPSLRSRLLALGWKDMTSEMRGKTITIIGAPRPRRQKPQPPE